MAFRHPTSVPPARPISTPAAEQQAIRPFHQTHSLEDSREWILFPSRQSAASYTQETSTDRTPRTAGLSRLSDFGSLNSGAQSGEPEINGAGIAFNGLDEEDEGLDSLDEGLHAFQEPSKLLSERFHPSSNSILPRHDGLGGFPTSALVLEEQGSWLPDSDGVRPRKRSFGTQRRRTSMNMERGVQEEMMEDDQSLFDGERRARIEKWRLDHSRIMLSEIERETRRRRASFRTQESSLTDEERSRVELEGFGQIIRDQNIADRTHSSPATTITRTGAEEDDYETFWERMTRRVIRDIMGIDDDILSVILGESLVDEDTTSGSPPSKAPRLDDPTTLAATTKNTTWERRLISRVARELDILFNQVPDRPSAVVVPTPFNPTALDYAGLPVSQPTSSRTHRPRPILRSIPSGPQVNEEKASPNSFTFNPTLQNTAKSNPSALETSSHAALWGIEEEPSKESEQEYWESTPSLKEIFQRFLHTRFPSYTVGTHSTPSHCRPKATHTHNIATISTPDRLRRAALIRQHHPLTNRAAAAQHKRRRSWLRRGSSCASESARRSTVARSSVATSTSRNYWDLGGSSIAGSGVGAWGEV